MFVQLPDVGLEIVAGASAAEIESTKSVSDVYVPVSGVVQRVNEALVDAPELVNQDPYGAGWILEVDAGRSRRARRAHGRRRLPRRSSARTDRDQVETLNSQAQVEIELPLWAIDRPRIP